MKLLDSPIQKEAEVSNKEAIVKMLAGAGIGGGAGVLGELMMTGKLGWKGGTLGALLGTGASAYLNPESRDKLISTVKEKFSGSEADEETPETVPSDATTLSDAPKEEEFTDTEYYNHFKELLGSGQEFSEEQIKGMEEFVTYYDQDKDAIKRYKQGNVTGTQLRKDPRFDKVFKETRADEGNADISSIVFQYANEYKKKKGKFPTEDQLLRFTRHTRDGLSPEEWGDYIQDKHSMSGMEEYPLSLAALQMGGGYGSSKLTKPAIEKMLKTPGGRKSLEKIFGSSVENKGLKKFLLGKGGGKGAAKLSARAIPGLNILMDIPEFFLDPNTGEYTTNVGKNIAEQDRLMELRERQGTMIGTGNKRNMQYNMSAGALRGWFNPLTSTTIAGKRYKDTLVAAADNLKNRGFLQGAKSNVQAGASALATTGSELWSPIQDAMWWQKKAVKPTKYSWGADVAAPTEKEIREHRQANKWHRKEGEDHMDSIDLVRRVIRKQATLHKEAFNLKAIQRLIKGGQSPETIHRKLVADYGNKIPKDVDAYLKQQMQKAAKKTAKDAADVPATPMGWDPKRKPMEWFKQKARNAGWRPGVEAPTRKGKLGLYGTGALVTGLAAKYMGEEAGGGSIDEQVDLESKITNKEVQDARDARDESFRDGKPQVENAEIPPELLAGAGGAVAGGAAGYALAPTLGISRGVGAVGGGALTAIASALLANKLKNSNTSKAEPIKT